MPDTYQGTELWDFSLVDPDNRRPVDYGKRREMLAALKAKPAATGVSWPGELVAAKEDGRIKLYVTHLALQLRHENPGLFADGTYVPLEGEGPRKDHAFGFVRGKEGRSAAVIVPRFVTRLAAAAEWNPNGPGVGGYGGAFAGGGGRAALAECLHGRNAGASGGSLLLADVLRDFPVALLMGERPA